MQENFPKQLKQYLNMLETAPADTDTIKTIAEYLFSQPGYLDNSKPAVTLLSALGDWLKGVQQNPDNIHTALYRFWLHYMQQKKIDLFYIGNLENLKKLVPWLNPDVISQVYFLSGNENSQEEIDRYLSKINPGSVSFIIYDPEGLKIALSVDPAQTSGKVSFYELLIANYIPVSNEVNYYAYIMAKQYSALNNPTIRSVIIGNSYGLYGFPDPAIHNSVNLSMHSLGLKQSQNMAEHIIIRYPHIDTFIFCLGFFDLYSDLLKTNDAFNRQIICAFNQFSSHHGIKSIYATPCDDTIVLSHLVIQQPFQPRLLNAFENQQLKESYFSSNLSLLTQRTCLTKEQHRQTAKQRAVLHSNNVKHKLTLKENKKIVKEMINSFTRAGKKAIWLTPPFPDYYVKNIHQKMKITHRQFFSQLNNHHSIFIDLSENKNFRRHDFRDGDHLNFTGAEKLVEKLRGLNIPL